MSSPYQRKITISAGEECTLSGSCVVGLQLLSGVVEVAGVLLKAKEPPTFRLLTDRYSLVMYTLEGGCVLATSTKQFEVSKAATGMASVGQLCRGALATVTRSKVLVIGRRASGKTLTAHTICNILREDASAVELGAASTSVFLMDLNAESNSIYAPGCISTVLVEHILWPDTSASPTLLPFSLFVGETAPPGNESVASFLSFVEQLNECTDALIGAANTERAHVVIDAPSPQEGVMEGVYFRRLVELLRPTHVVMVSTQGESDLCSNVLQEDIQRVLPECDVSYVAPVSQRCNSSVREQRLCGYFSGNPQCPLACAKIVLPLAQVQFVRYVRSESGVTCSKVTPSATIIGCICAVSHAEVIEEVPLAPIAGLLLLFAIDEEHEELVAVVPASEPLPRRFLILPNEPTRSCPPSALFSGEVAAHVEEAVAI
ncbi:hypothetical protein, conserved [Trypanosoma brucei gambiense DAL972]|uniref:Uncharacterized protein n=1 Tax=Trypanosoma brucei gambiense (strain MHOM/CI/86/DAL972) TaxID=679716 RepID=D0A8H5_TRYB9|nr:hypothetical protein, conserved [Trypanosoma brucei gambiense DAL972]CBH17976.1 hypothetical protein, conserved [Trypanosoma brucei gambiense DAL972]|eukprot:XP_011780240.1 hypothetical protein, conserved [Trypanosoma brucei gambiense DAL972]